MPRKTKEEAQQTRRQLIDAARQVFHARGVGRASLEQVAQAAGVTRGAVYHHFADKAALFFAVREQAFEPLIARTDALLLGSEGDPLAAIAQSLLDFFRAFDECPDVRTMFEILMLRCEYVDEFAAVQPEVNRPSLDYLRKLEVAYGRAAERALLREGLGAQAAALDTWAFANGLLNQLVRAQPGDRTLNERIPAMVATHMRLRRRGGAPGALDGGEPPRDRD